LKKEEEQTIQVIEKKSIIQITKAKTVTIEKSSPKLITIDNPT
jgi:hypothetical protein